MRIERPALVHESFLKRLADLSARDAKLQRIVEDKIRLLSECPDPAKYAIKLADTHKKERHLHGRLLHLDLGKCRRRLFVVRWIASRPGARTCDIMIPCAVSEPHDKLDYSARSLAPIIGSANLIVEAFSAGEASAFVAWLATGNGVREEKITTWPFLRRTTG